MEHPIDNDAINENTFLIQRGMNNNHLINLLSSQQKYLNVLEEHDIKSWSNLESGALIPTDDVFDVTWY